VLFTMNNCNLSAMCSIYASQDDLLELKDEPLVSKQTSPEYGKYEYLKFISTEHEHNNDSFDTNVKLRK
jgi:hypothetical protein